MRSLAFVRDSYHFWMGGLLATQLEEITTDPNKLNGGGFWVAHVTFEGISTFARFGKVERTEFRQSNWPGVESTWQSSFDREGFVSYVSAIRDAISLGAVYQVNACRILRNRIGEDQSLSGLFSRLLAENPAPYASYLHLPDIEIASASPELFLSVNSRKIKTSPIKGTIREDEGIFGEKDQAENLMIVDLMRNDLGRICEPGTVEVSQLFRSEKHPGLSHLVSDVVGTLRVDANWSEIFDAIMPPGSVSGAPKSSALSIIREKERARGPYCGTIGWINGDKALLSVAIRTFWKSGPDEISFGTGAGITWGSDPMKEWEETQLKARKLISIAGGNLDES